MELIGVLLIFVLPYLVGYLLKIITKQKETGQIETYLTGFFFLFLLQGVIFFSGVLMKTGYSKIYSFFCVVLLILMIILLAIAAFTVIRRVVRKEKTGRIVLKKDKWKREEKILFCIMLFVFVLVGVRILSGEQTLRNDDMIETIRTTLQTDTMYQYHPLTGQPFEAGMILSKKLITLPFFYSALSKITEIAPDILIYDFISILTLIVSCFAISLLFSDLFRHVRRKVFTFEIIYGLLILSGDYLKDNLAYHIMWNGYAGATICAAVMVPYLLYLLIQWFKKENGEEKVTLFIRLMYILKTAVCLLASLFMTGIATGFLFLVITIVIAAVCCQIIAVKEVRECR